MTSLDHHSPGLWKEAHARAIGGLALAFLISWLQAGMSPSAALDLLMRGVGLLFLIAMAGLSYVALYMAAYIRAFGVSGPYRLQQARGQLAAFGVFILGPLGTMIGMRSLFGELANGGVGGVSMLFPNMDMALTSTIVSMLIYPLLLLDLHSADAAVRDELERKGKRETDTDDAFNF